MSAILPSDPFQARVTQATTRRDIAKIMMEKAMAEQSPGRMVGTHFVGTSPWQTLANGVQQVAGAYLSGKANDDIAQAGVQRQAAVGQEAASLTGRAMGSPGYPTSDEGPTPVQPGQRPFANPDLPGAMAGASASPFAENRKLGELFQKQLEMQNTNQQNDKNRTNNRLTAGYPYADPASIPGAEAPNQLKPAVAAPPQFLPQPDGSTQIINTGKQGLTQTGSISQPNKGTTIDLGSKDGSALNQQIDKQTLDRITDPKTGSFTQAENNAAQLRTNSQIMQVMDSNSKPGMMAPTEMWVSRLASSLGFSPNDPKASDLNYLANALKERTYQKLGTLGAGVSKGDLDFVNSFNGNLMSDPEALKRMLALDSVGAQRQIEKHNELVDGLRGSVKDPDRENTLSKYRVNASFIPGSAEKYYLSAAGTTPEAIAAETPGMPAPTGKAIMRAPAGEVPQAPGTKKAEVDPQAPKGAEVVQRQTWGRKK